MKSPVSIVMLLVVSCVLSGCVLNVPHMQFNFCVDEPKGPAYGDMACVWCTVAITQVCIREAAEKIGFSPEVSDTEFRAVSYRHITPRKLHGVLNEVEWGVVVSASVDAAFPTTKSRLMLLFAAGMNSCNTRLAPAQLIEQ